MDEVLGLTGKALLAHQASAKIEDGRRMVAEGRLELLNLFSDADRKPPVANRTLRDPGSFKMKTKTDDELMILVINMIKKGERVTTNFLRKRLSITHSHVVRLREKMRDKVTDKADSKSGNARIWKLASKTKTNAITDSLDPERVQKVLGLLKVDSWCTLKKLQTALSIDWYLLNKIIRYLADKGLAKSIKKTHNPEHKDNSSFNREFVYWIAV